MGVGPQKLKFLLRFDQNVVLRIPWRFSQNLQSLYAISGCVKIWLDLLERLWSYGGFKLRGSGFPQISSAP